MDERTLRFPGRALRAALLGALLAVAAAAPASATTCDAVDTPAALAASLDPGQVGCVHAGTYAGSIKITRPGITITSYPGERATIFGRVWIAAADVTVADMNLDARQTTNQPSVLILADRATLSGDDITNGHTAICVNIGAATWTPTVVAHDVVVSGNRIHDCGRLPATNHDHGIYVENAVGTKILGNAIFDNADRAINLYPNADGSVIRGNVMDGNGEGVLFSGDLGMASDDNVVEGNVLTNPKLRAAVESWFPAGNPVGTGNVVRNNCIHGGAGTIDASGGGFSVGLGNLLVDPLYVDRAAKDFALAAGSPCAALLTTAAPAPVTDVVTVPSVPLPPAPTTQTTQTTTSQTSGGGSTSSTTTTVPAGTTTATTTTTAHRPATTTKRKPTARQRAAAKRKLLARKASLTCAASRRVRAAQARIAARRACSRALRRARAAR